MLNYLNDNSKTVKTFSMQALTELARDDPTLHPKAHRILEELAETGNPAMHSRGVSC